MLLTTPESLIKNSGLIEYIKKAIEENLIHRVIVDEAHVVLSWGDSFRPSYRKIFYSWRDLKHQFAYSFVSATLKTTEIFDLMALLKLANLTLLSCMVLFYNKRHV